MLILRLALPQITSPSSLATAVVRPPVISLAQLRQHSVPAAAAPPLPAAVNEARRDSNLDGRPCQWIITSHRVACLLSACSHMVRIRCRPQVPSRRSSSNNSRHRCCSMVAAIHPPPIHHHPQRVSPLRI